MRWAWLAALLLAAAGCASLPSDPALRLHVVMVDPEGELRDPVGDREVLPAGPESPRTAYFDAMFEAMERETAPGPRRVVLFVHGGLNSPEDGIVRADQVLAEIRRTADPTRPPPFVVFVNWDSSFASCYFDHLFSIRQGKDRSGASLWLLASPFYFAADILRGAVSAPLLWFREIEMVAGAETGEVHDADRRSEWYAGRTGGLTVRRGRDGSSGLLESFQRGLFLPFRAVTMPFVHGFGTSSWETMQRRISMMFHLEEEFTAGQGSAAPRGALHQFLDGLRRRTGDGERWDVTLMGHSLGATVMNRMLREAPDIHYSRIVYMAAACSVRDYADSVMPYMRHPDHAGTRMVHLMLDDRAERSEKFWDLVDVVPRGTLLAWLDAYLSTPPTRLDRSAGRFVNLVTAPANIFEEYGVGARTLLWQFDGGDPAAPQRHEDFDEVRFRFWEEEWWERAGGDSP